MTNGYLLSFLKYVIIILSTLKYKLENIMDNISRKSSDSFTPSEAQVEASGENFLSLLFGMRKEVGVTFIEAQRATNWRNRFKKGLGGEPSGKPD